MVHHLSARLPSATVALLLAPMALGSMTACRRPVPELPKASAEDSAASAALLASLRTPPIVAPAYDSASGVALEVSVNPAVVVGDDELWLTYVLRNRGNAPVNVDVGPMTVGIKVFPPSGQRLIRVESGYVSLYTPPVSLPAGGAFTRSLNLRCISWEGEAPVRTPDGKCGFRYDLEEPGEYRIFVHYRSGGSPEGPVKSIALDADTVRFTYRPK
jgi:hypothetical protein